MINYEIKNVSLFINFTSVNYSLMLYLRKVFVNSKHQPYTNMKFIYVIYR